MNKTVIIVAGGTRFLAEVDIGGGEGIPPGMKPISRGEQLEQEFSSIKRVIGAIANEMSEIISEIPAPSDVKMEFCLKLGGEAGIPILTKVTGEASFKITLQWSPHKIT